jgi:hypothetical protein
MIAPAPNLPPASLAPATLEYLAPRLSPDLYAYWATSGGYARWPHIRMIGQTLAAAISRGGARIIINLPPGYGKSWLCSVWTPTWYLDLNPAAKVVCAAANESLALRNARWVRDRVEQLPRVAARVRLREDNRAAGFWQTQEQGGMLAVGVGSGLLGHRINLGLIDDHYATWADAQSPAYRRGLEEWYDGTFHSRLEPGASVVVIMHRMHAEDLTAYLTKREPSVWQVVRLPDIAEYRDPMGREPGDPLCPARYTLEDIRATRRAVGRAMFAAMHQQKPLEQGKGTAYHAFLPSAYPYGNVAEEVPYDFSLPLHITLDYNVVPGMHAILGQYDPFRDLAWATEEVFSPGMRLHACLAEIERRIRLWSNRALAAGGAAERNKALAGRGGLGWPYLELFGDAAKGSSTLTSATHQSTVRKWARALRWPYKWHIPKGNPRVVDRVDRVNEAFRDVDGTVHYVVSRACPRLIRDYLEVRMEGAGLDKGNPELTHASDAEGYRLYRIRPGRMLQNRERRTLVLTGEGEPVE